MPTELTGTNNWRATLTAPSSGENRTAASVQTLGQDIADSLVYLKTAHDALDTTVSGLSNVVYSAGASGTLATNIANGATSTWVTDTQTVQAGDIIQVTATLMFQWSAYNGSPSAASNFTVDIDGDTATLDLNLLCDSAAPQNKYVTLCHTATAGDTSCAIALKAANNIGGGYTLSLLHQSYSILIIRPAGS